MGNAVVHGPNNTKAAARGLKHQGVWEASPRLLSRTDWTQSPGHFTSHLLLSGSVLSVPSYWAPPYQSLVTASDLSES